jgi:hypothetical protein
LLLPAGAASVRAQMVRAPLEAADAPIAALSAALYNASEPAGAG